MQTRLRYRCDRETDRQLYIYIRKGIRVGTTSEARALPLFKASTKFLIGFDLNKAQGKGKRAFHT